MSSIEKAELAPLDNKGKAGKAVVVQFNPNTMSLSMANSIDGTKNTGRQTRKYTGTSSTTLSIELEFDTADDGTDVRKKTAEVAQFVLPAGDKSKKAPPRVRFSWGTFELSGIMSSLSEELSFFSSDGTPLRAKLGIEIKEQDPKYAALETGPGSDSDASAPPAGGTGDNPAAPGSAAAAAADRAAEALADESPADFLARNGLAPEAWRALGSALDALEDGVSLPGGLAIPFPSSLSLGAGIGISAGFQAGLGVSFGASVGLEAGASDQGFALSAAGGLSAASEAATQRQSEAAAHEARTSFGVSSAATTSGSTSSGAPRVPAAGSVSGARQPVAASPTARTLNAGRSAPLAPPPAADRRAATYGRGAPLRDRVHIPGSQPSGWVVIGHADPIAVTKTVGRSRKAPWESLPADSGRTRADHEQQKRNPECGCHRCDPRSRRRYNS